MIDLHRLQVLRAVHHHGTVGAAAESLHLTPSAVSQQIRRLSRELGTDLLRPEGRRVRLTSAAHLLLDHADTLNAQWERARADLAAHGGHETGPLRMYGYPTAIAGFLAPAAAGLRDTRPGLRVRITEAEAAACFSLLLADTADLAVVVAGAACPPLDDPRFDQYPLLDEPLDLLVPPGHPLAGRADTELADAAHEPWILPEPGTCDHYHHALAACSAAGFSPRITQHATEWLAVNALVANGLGVALVPRRLPLHAEHSVTRIRLQGEVRPTRRILACVRGGSADHPAIAAGLKALTRVAEETPDPGRPLAPEPV